MPSMSARMAIIASIASPVLSCNIYCGIAGIVYNFMFTTNHVNKQENAKEIK